MVTEQKTPAPTVRASDHRERNHRDNRDNHHTCPACRSETTHLEHGTEVNHPCGHRSRRVGNVLITRRLSPGDPTPQESLRLRHQHAGEDSLAKQGRLARYIMETTQQERAGRDPDTQEATVEPVGPAQGRGRGMKLDWPSLALGLLAGTCVTLLVT